MNETGSTVPKRQVGRLLRQLREQAGISLMAAAGELEFSRARMYRIENGEVPVRKHDVIAMCGVYSAPRHITEVVIGLAAESKAKGWWHAYGDVVPAWFELYVGMEQAASRLRSYAPGVIPGLLQTREYAEAVFRGWHADPDAVAGAAVGCSGRTQEDRSEAGGAEACRAPCRGRAETGLRGEDREAGGGQAGRSEAGPPPRLRTRSGR
jgi:transcriptional regulator with XRE-family HTH domain